jgi:hypothetical protein
MHVTVEGSRARQLTADTFHYLALFEVMTLSHGDVSLNPDHRR